MFLRLSLLFIHLTVLFSSSVLAVWPEDGWEGVHSLNIKHKEKIVNFDNLHRDLAREEEKLTSLLPPDDKMNVVLASVSFLGGNEENPLHTYQLKRENKWLVFESGWTSSFSDNPVLEEAQRRMRPYANDLKKTEGVSHQSMESLLQDCIEIAQKQKHFLEVVKPNFHFFKREETSIEATIQTILTIFDRVKTTFSSIQPGEPGYPLYEAFLKDSAAFLKLVEGLKTIKVEGRQDIKELSDKITDDGINLKIIAELENIVKTHQKDLLAQEKEVTKISSKVIATYWHSEQRFLKHLEDSLSDLLETLLMEKVPFKPEAIFINIHSRHDICRVCSHTFVQSYTQPMGVISFFHTELCKKFGLDLKTPLHITSSFRDLRQGTQYQLREQPAQSLEDLKTIYPAITTLQIH